ncbi:MAG: putative bifunctional diguanylate cyclase/phosphodiesterase [Gemmatimonadaceae bacterium]
MPIDLLESLPERDGRSRHRTLEQSHWASPHLRTMLVAKMRWIMLAVLGSYSLFAAACLAFDRVPRFLTWPQQLLLLLVTGVVASYNLFFQFSYEAVRHLRWVDHLQVVLDLMFVTVVIHFSGGAVSWFWPIYLLVTIEAAFLLPRQEDVWMVGAIGGALYAMLLAGHFADVIHPIRMPFLPAVLPNNGLFLLLIVCWVAILNSAVALITAYFMSVIRNEHMAFGLSQERLQNFLNNANDLIFSCSADGRFLFVNPACQDQMGYSAHELASMRFQDLVELDQQSRRLLEFRRALSGEKGTVLEGDLIAKDGSRISVEGHITCTSREGASQVVWCICRDVTERKAAERQLFRLAHFDSLTGLPNRSTSMGRIQSALDMARRDHKQAALLFLDLDRFKLINDTRGHLAGDELLKAVGRRLKAAVREVDTVCRLGGDEFVVALVNLNSVKDVSALAAKLLKPLAMCFDIEGHELFVTASMGISMFPMDGEDPEILLRKADTAMYQAKRGGRNTFVFYDPQMDEDAGLRLLQATDIQRALEENELRVYYQPKHHPGTCGITSMEALLRWNHPDLGLLSPNEFVPLAEETGLILPLGDWVLRRVAEQHAAWRREGLPNIRIGVNLSGYQLQQPSFASRVKAILAEAGMSPESLEFEITETVVMQSPDLAASVLKDITEMGIHVAIDDFGTGYSSLAYIKRFSVSSLKIDKSFIKDLEKNPTDAAIATAIIAMAASLNLQVVAEGVETVAQLDFLRDKRCDEVQGFLFSEPVPAEQISRYLKTYPTADDHSLRIQSRPANYPTSPGHDHTARHDGHRSVETLVRASQ